MNYNFTCRGCTARYGGCHAKCETYKREKAEYERLREEQAKNKRVEAGLRHYTFCQMAKSQKGKGRAWNGKEGRNVE